jgi:hypothetical protein
MKGIQGTLKLKDNKIEVPSNYLRAQILQKAIDCIPVWTMTSEQYMKVVIANVETKQTRKDSVYPPDALLL